jgi:hypothetical protein
VTLNCRAEGLLLPTLALRWGSCKAMLLQIRIAQLGSSHGAGACLT